MSTGDRTIATQQRAPTPVDHSNFTERGTVAETMAPQCTIDSDVIRRVLKADSPILTVPTLVVVMGH